MNVSTSPTSPNAPRFGTNVPDASHSYWGPSQYLRLLFKHALVPNVINRPLGIFLRPCADRLVRDWAHFAGSGEAPGPQAGGRAARVERWREPCRFESHLEKGRREKGEASCAHCANL